MTETTQGLRNTARADVDRHEPYASVMFSARFIQGLINDADRLAQHERDLHDDVGKDRSQDTDWLRAGFLQRGAEIERLEDRLAQTEALLREARTVISMAANDADEIRRIKSGPNAAAAMQRRDKAWAVEAKIDAIMED